MKIQQNISLKPFNTFGIQANAKRFVTVNSVIELKEVIASEKDLFILGGGSNILLTGDVEKLVIHLNTKGIIINDFDSNGYKIKDLTRDIEDLTRIPVLGSIPFIDNFSDSSLNKIFKKNLNLKLLLK